MIIFALYGGMLTRPDSSLYCDHNVGFTSVMLYLNRCGSSLLMNYGITPTFAFGTSESKEKLTELSENTISMSSLCMRSLPKRFNGEFETPTERIV